MSDLYQILDDYIATRHAMGHKLEHADRRLHEFVDSVLAAGSSSITTKLALQWTTKPVGAAPAWLARRLGIVRQFALYAQSFDPRTEVPPPHLLPQPSRRPTPYIYSEEDIDRLLEAARSQRIHLSACTDTALLALLAITGIRVGEAIKLDRRDLDEDRGLLVVRESKFGKSREIPLHPSTVEALRRYVRNRDRLLPVQYSSQLFLSQVGKPLLYRCVQSRFQRLIDRAGLANRSPRRPRIHDLRHSFVARTLIGWYRSGVEVESRLPLLSTYLGHINPATTYWYLTAVPELLALVNERCQRRHEVHT
ncbi:MAG TPA: tyrosine-type recombinase/integrase [Coriobacteriia bacterium]|nr:tyrosine-type recombinase/integrase [Coriobacteriia bacterium]